MTRAVVANVLIDREVNTSPMTATTPAPAEDDDADADDQIEVTSVKQVATRARKSAFFKTLVHSLK